jgi:hypothetical protein
VLVESNVRARSDFGSEAGSSQMFRSADLARKIPLQILERYPVSIRNSCHPNFGLFERGRGVSFLRGMVQ